MSSIILYIEGGGDTEKCWRREFRLAFGKFFSRLRNLAYNNGIRFRVVMCGGRSSTYDDYLTGVKANKSSFCILLVDSEDYPTRAPWAHVQDRDKWQRIGSDDHCHLFVVVMETWLISDIAMLEKYYGSGFKATKLPQHTNLESVSKQDVYNDLESATKESEKGAYHKTHHAPDLITQLSESKARILPHCERLFATIEKLL